MPTFSTASTSAALSSFRRSLELCSNRKKFILTSVVATLTGIAAYYIMATRRKKDDEHSLLLEQLKEIGKRLSGLEGEKKTTLSMRKTEDDIEEKKIKDSVDAIPLMKIQTHKVTNVRPFRGKRASIDTNINAPQYENSSDDDDANALIPLLPRTILTQQKRRISMGSCGSTGSRYDQDKNDPVPIVLISDPGQDLDDEMMFIMARHLVSLNLISLKGVIANLHPSFARARLTRGTLDLLGLHKVPVGIGTDGGDIIGRHSSDQFESTARSYIVQSDGEAARGLESGHKLLQRLYDEAKAVEYVDIFDDSKGNEPRLVISNDPKNNITAKKVARGGLVLVITSSMKDAAIFVRENPSLFASKTREVVIMGGFKPVERDLASIEDDTMSEQDRDVVTSVWSELARTECLPDSANNNTFDAAASEYLYSQCQKLKVTLTVVSRFAAYAAKMPRSVYDDLALTGSSIGWRLRNSQRSSIDQLWRRACSNDPDIRLGLPPRCDRKWFIDTFCGGEDDESRCCEDTAWDLVTGFMQYDTLALLAAIPGVREKYFDPFVLPPFVELAETKTHHNPAISHLFQTRAACDETKLVESDETGDNEDENGIIKGTSAKTNGDLIPSQFRRSRRVSFPGPVFIQRAILKANEDNSKIELPNSNPPLETSIAPSAFDRGTRNLIGRSDMEHNLKDPSLLVDLLKSGYRSGLLRNHHTQPHLILHMQLRWDNIADTFMTCLMLRSLWDMRLASVLGVIVSINPSDAESGQGTCNGQGTFDSNTSSVGSPEDQSPSTLIGLAETVRETLSLVGLSHVKFIVVSGTNSNEYKLKSTEALLDLYESAPPIGVTLVLTATFTSVWPFAKNYPDLFRNKTVRVVHTGGALVWPARWGWANCESSSTENVDDEITNDSSNINELTEEKILVPDPAAQNHRLDLESARLFYKQAQSLSVPMVILSRHVAKECCIPRNFFDVLGSHGGKVGRRIYQSERHSLLNLWRCSCAPLGSHARGNLPDRCDRVWFARTFCAGIEANGDDDVWNAVDSVNLYSPIALLAALPGETLKNYFTTLPFTVRSATHHVIGLTEEIPPRNVVNPGELRSLVIQSLLSAALANESEFKTGLPPKVSIRMETEHRRKFYKTRRNSVSSTITDTDNFGEEDDDMWTFSEAARRELFNRMSVRISKNLVMPKEKVRKFVNANDELQSIGFVPPKDAEEIKLSSSAGSAPAMFLT